MGTDVLQQTTGRVLELTLNRPEAGNAMDAALIEALIEALDAINGEVCDTVVFRGAGKGFCGGLDLSVLDSETDASLLWRLVRIEHLLQKVNALPQETVAFAHRFSFGAGADLFIACRRRIAAPGTRFSFPGVRFGIALGTGRLGRRIGPEAARRLLAATAPISMAEALDTGLVQKEHDVDAWPEIIEALGSQSTSLDAQMARIVAERLDPGKDDEDLAALIRSAGRPGLKDRVANYAAAVAAARKRAG
ncbi:MAG: enoyl-CoA hydratase/isomerase family protein [Alphaproteobacteria bacterium]|nr:enoyl-CoA hydratase/isomerase family protein [Alphaproteobacteria bacterium]